MYGSLHLRFFLAFITTIIVECAFATDSSVSSRCHIPVATAKKGTFSAKYFNEKYRQKSPVLLRNITSTWNALSSWSTLESFLQKHGELRPVIRPQIDIHQTGVPPGDTGILRMTLRDFFSEERVRDKIVLAFNDLPIYRAMRPDYAPLPEALRAVHQLPMLTVGRNGTGSDGHRHDENWVAQIVGRKVWMLAPPGTTTPPQQLLPCPLLETRGSFPEHLVVCEVVPGEVIYLPEGWYHATCNLNSPDNNIIAGIGAKSASDSWTSAMFHLQNADEDALRANDADLQRLAYMRDPPALMVAAKDGPVSLVEFLLERRANPHVKDPSGWGMIHTAAEAGTASVIDYLLSQGLARPEDNIQGTEPLHMAAGKGHHEAVLSLLSARANVNARDGRGCLPMHWAAASGDTRTVKAILQHRGNPAAKDGESGSRPLAWARRAKHAAVVDLLKGLRGTKKEL